MPFIPASCNLPVTISIGMKDISISTAIASRRVKSLAVYSNCYMWNLNNISFKISYSHQNEYALVVTGRESSLNKLCNKLQQCFIQTVTIFTYSTKQPVSGMVNWVTVNITENNVSLSTIKGFFPPFKIVKYHSGFNGICSDCETCTLAVVHRRWLKYYIQKKS